jgi:hypothetical protein
MQPAITQRGCNRVLKFSGCNLALVLRGWGRFRSKDACARHNGTAPQAQASAARTDDRGGQRRRRIAHRVTQRIASSGFLLLVPGAVAGRTGRAGDVTAAGASLPVPPDSAAPDR